MEIIEEKHPWYIKQSYALTGFLDNFMTGAFSIRIYAYYEAVLGFESNLVAIAFIIYGIFNMINDPLVGWLSDRPFKFIKKWGRRYPWYLFFAMPFALSYLLCFIVPVPKGMIWLEFSWLLFTICLFDFFFSFWQLNWLALYPVKFRNQKERSAVGGWNTVYGIIGVAIGMLVPPLFIDYGVEITYVWSAVFVTAVGVFIATLGIPGMRESEKIREIQWKMVQETLQEKQEGRAQSFWKTLWKTIREKNFMAYIFFFLGHMVMTTMMLASLEYWSRWLIPITEVNEDNETFVSAALLIGVLLTTPLWVWISRKYGNKTAFMIGGASASVVLLGFFLVPQNIISGMIFTALTGATIGAMWTLMYPGLSDVLDEITAKTGIRREGVLTGIRTFFGRLSIVIQAVSFWIVHELTGFDQTLTVQPSTAQLGIRIHMALIPAIFYFIGFLFIWLRYDLTKEKMGKIKQKIAELNL